MDFDFCLLIVLLFIFVVVGWVVFNIGVVVM